jgi:hypothetical protein
MLFFELFIIKVNQVKLIIPIKDCFYIQLTITFITFEVIKIKD